MKIEICTSRETKPDFVSRMIMKFMGTKYSHILVLIDNSIVWHMTGKGFHSQPADEFLSDHLFVDCVDVSTKVTRSEEYCKGYLEGMRGGEYSQSQYLGFLRKRLQRFTKNGNEKSVCSESVARIMHDWGVMYFPEDVRDFLSPEDVIEALKKAVKS